MKKLQKLQRNYQPTLVYRSDPTLPWSIESIHKHGANTMSCVLVSGPNQTPLIGTYLTPQQLDDLPHVQAALDRFTDSHIRPLLLGDFNADITKQADHRCTTMANFLATNRLDDMLPNFRQRKRFRHCKTWNQHRRPIGQPWMPVQTIRTRCDYICGSDHRFFQRVSIREPRYSTNHYMVEATLFSALPSCHKRYLRGRK